MNRPLKRKLALAILAWLDQHKAGKAFEALTMVTGSGTTLAQEAAFDAAGARAEVAEPAAPFLAVDVATVRDTDMPGVCSFEAVLHLKTLSTDGEEGEASSRFDADEILRDLYDVLVMPLNDGAAFSDANGECVALAVFANKPEGADTRPGYRVPLHLYGMWPTSEPSLFDGDQWHDQMVFSGHAQDMDSS